MKTIFKTYDNRDYKIVCDFLIELSRDNRKLINWNWARWEWMVFHPEFDSSLAGKIGLWFCNSELVGMTTYDHYFGEACYAVKKGYEELEKEILEYAINNFSNENGLGIAVNNDDSHAIDLLLNYGFVKHNNAENILENTFEEKSFDYSFPEGIEVKNLDISNDVYKHHKVLWQGFENEGNLPLDEKTIEKQAESTSFKLISASSCSKRRW